MMCCLAIRVTLILPEIKEKLLLNCLDEVESFYVSKVIVAKG